MKSFADITLNAAWAGLLMLVVVMVLESWGYWGRGSAGSDDPVGNGGGEARGEDVSTLTGSWLICEMPEVEGWGSGGLMPSFFLNKEKNAIWETLASFSLKITV